MFADFIAAATLAGFTARPESCGHDLILQAPAAAENRHPHGDGLEGGDIIAIEGKLRPCLEVLHQALPPFRSFRVGWNSGEELRSADFYAVLIPGTPSQKFRELAHALGIVVLCWPPPKARRWRPAGVSAWSDYWHERWSDEYRCYGRPLDLPPVVVQAAGEPAPRRVTPWKLDAVRICLRHATGQLRAKDFGNTTVRPRTFVDRGWMRVVGRDGRAAIYELVEHPTRPDVVYPEIVAAVRAELG
jgi:hypothetical protein